MKKIIKLTLAIAVLMIAIISGCRKDSTLIVKLKTVEVKDTVYFAKDLVPIFVANCALSGCHGSGAKAPILTADKAYASLMANPDYINVKDPESSELYAFLTGAKSPAMPMGKPANPSNLNGLLLAWIKQGANKN